MNARTQELLDRLVSPEQFPNMSCSEGYELYQGIMNETKRLSEAAKLLDDLVGYTSYAEIVGGISVNRRPIRYVCDATFAFLAKLKEEPK